MAHVASDSRATGPRQQGHRPATERQNETTEKTKQDQNVDPENSLGRDNGHRVTGR